jgi:hypothetical protein
LQRAERVPNADVREFALVLSDSQPLPGEENNRQSSDELPPLMVGMPVAARHG